MHIFAVKIETVNRKKKCAKSSTGSYLYHMVTDTTLRISCLPCTSPRTSPPVSWLRTADPAARMVCGRG